MSSKKNKIILTIILLSITVASYCIVDTSAETPRLVIRLTPSIIPADGAEHELVVVQLQSPNGNPFIPNDDVTVYLTSSNLEIGTVEEEIVISSGKSYGKGYFTSNFEAGISVVSASAKSFQTGEATLQVIKSDFDSILRVYASPNWMPNQTDVEGKAVIQIMDSEGTPYNTLQDVQVTLASSNHTIITLQESAEIKKGTNYVEVPFKTMSEIPGSAIIYAHAPNFEPGSDIVNTFNSSKPSYKISLFFGPELLLPDQQSHQAVTVQLQDIFGNPVKAESDIIIQLTSSNLNIASVTDTLVIPKNSYHAETSVTTRYVNGVTTIAASTPGLFPDHESLTILGAVPTILSIYTVPSKVLADGQVNDIITLQVLDEQGNPIKADRDISLFLSSSYPDIGTVPITVTIEKGNSYVSAPFTATDSSGETTIVVTTQGLEPAESLIETMVLGLNVTMTTPTNIQLNQTFTAKVNVTSYGLPVPGAEVKWSALGGVIKAEDTYTDENGVATVDIVQTYEQLNIKAEITKTGYKSESANKNIKITQQTSTPELTINILGFEISVFMILIIGAGILAIALAGYVYLKYRRNKNDEPDDLEIFQ
ncbi:MAG: Ig-like domain-containing protein [Candidatus Bathyarchaeota archaeon]|nr:Ig-like domain-containing protein [Candidatus Bathyarchaeota archaeon]